MQEKDRQQQKAAGFFDLLGAAANNAGADQHDGDDRNQRGDRQHSFNQSRRQMMQRQAED